MEKVKRPSANATREKILHAAKTLFLDYGFNGTSIQNIAKLAEVNTNLIFHHYQNKENLWLQVKNHILESHSQPPNYDTSSAAAYFKSILDYRFELYSNNPDLTRLIKWQQITGQAEKLISNDFASPNHWKKDIIQFQKKGEIDPDLDFKLMTLFILFSSYAPFMQDAYPLSKAKKEQYKQIILKTCVSQFVVTNIKN